MGTDLYQQSTAHITKNMPKLSRTQAKELIARPAMCLIVVSGLVLVSIGGFGLYKGIQITNDLMNAEPPAPLATLPDETKEQKMERERKIKQAESERNFLSFSLTALIGLGFILCNAVVLAGALKMRQLKNIRFASTAAAFAVIPVLSPAIVVGIPFGVWALIVMHNKEVRRYFTT